MKKARALSTIFISLALTAPAWAQVPPAGSCFVRDYDAGHLAQNPQQGVAGLALWFYEATRGDPETASAVIRARLADQGQARAVGLGGQTLISHHTCHQQPGAGAAECFTECDGGVLSLNPRPDGGLEVVTDRIIVGTGDGGCGGTIDLAEGGARTVYRLAAAPAAACAELSTPHPLPVPGCYGAGDAGARLVVEAPDPAFAGATFPGQGGVLQIDLPNDPALRQFAGTRQRLDLYCWSGQASCTGADVTGTLTLTMEGVGLRVASRNAEILPAEGGAGIPVDAVLAALPLLSPLPAAACTGEGK